MNLVDSCGWLEHFSDGSNRAFFAGPLADTPRLLVANITVFEVCRRVLAIYGEAQARTAFRAMCSVPVVDLDPAGLFQAAVAAQRYRLHMADAIIWQTAQAHGASLYTQDAAFEGLPGVIFRARPG